MMPDDPISSLRRAGMRLRKAVESGAHEEAHTRLLDLRKRLEEAVAQASASAAPELVRETAALIEWARRAVLAGRAHTATQLTHLRPAPPGYRAGAGDHRHSWMLEG